MTQPGKTSRAIQAFKDALASKPMVIALAMGFASGFPLLLTKSTLKTWLRDEGVDLTTIGFFALAGLPYTLKFIWSPILDRYVLPFLGRRRGWLLVSQLALVAGFAGIAALSPQSQLEGIAIFALWIAFFSATQDIVIDAYRRETLTDQQLGLGSSLYVYGYRVAIWVTRTVPLVVAQLYSWQAAYLAMAGMMALNLAVTILSDEPEIEGEPPKGLKEAIVEPLKEFFTRSTVGQALLILLFILLFKFGDSYASLLTSPFYIDIGFTKIQIAKIDGTVGFVTQILGLFIGGSLIVLTGINRSLIICGFLQMISTAGFSLLAVAGTNMLIFAGVIGFENISSGMGTAAFVAFMARLADKRFTATQYALLTSLMTVSMNIFGATSGYVAKTLGWEWFFLACTLIAIPGIILSFKVAPWNEDRPSV